MQNSKKKRMNENLLHCQLSHVDVFRSLVIIIFNTCLNMHVVLRTIPKKGLSCLFGRIDRKKKKKRKKEKKNPCKLKSTKYITFLFWEIIIGTIYNHVSGYISCLFLDIKVLSCGRILINYCCFYQCSTLMPDPNWLFLWNEITQSFQSHFWWAQFHNFFK